MKSTTSPQGTNNGITTFHFPRPDERGHGEAQRRRDRIARNAARKARDGFGDRRPLACR
jgi:hypothetical protein